MIIKEIELLSASLADTISFYTDLLGLKQLTVPKKTAAFQVGKSRLIFRQADIGQPYYHFAIDIPHNKLLEAYSRLHGKVTLLPGQNNHPFTTFMEWNAQSFYFFDNNGNLLELICRYDLPNSSQNPFDAASFLRISEIGISTDSVADLAEQLRQQYHLLPFSKQQVMPAFAALGDEEGLLILAQQGRNWFPTSKPAETFFTRVVLCRSEEEESIELVFA